MLEDLCSLNFLLSSEDKIIAALLYCEIMIYVENVVSDKHYGQNCNQNHEPWVEKFGGELDINTRKYAAKCLKNINDKPKYFKLCEECFNSRKELKYKFEI